MASPRLRVLVAAAAALALTLTGHEAGARVQRPVRGIHQAYHGTLARPVGPRIKYRTFYFSGTQEDQLNKLAGSPTATFSTRKPTGDSAITQVASPMAEFDGDGPPDDPFSAFWSGRFSGRISGDVRLAWFWSSVNAFHAVLAPPVTVSFWGDGKLIGRGTVTVTTGPTPQRNVQSVRVNGTVKRTLVVQATTQYFDVGQDLRVNYGAASVPSGFAVPVGRAVKAPVIPKVPVNRPARYRGPRLELQAADVGAPTFEPTMGVRRDGTAFFYGATFYTVDTPLVKAQTFGPDVRRSRDGGRSWQSVQARLPDGHPDPPTTNDPILYVDPTTGRVFNLNLYAALCSDIHYSDDAGKTWTAVRFACGYPVNDHPTIVAGKPTAGVETDGYPNVLYYCAAQSFHQQCSRSLDGGDTWTVLPAAPFPAVAPGGGQGCGGPSGHLITDRAGRVFIPTGRCGVPVIAISEDGGMSWRRVVVSDVSAYSLQTSVAADDLGNLFYTWYDATNKLPYLSHSTDHGKTWSPPRMIAPPGVRQVNWPSIDAGRRGRIAISFPGTTHLPPPPPVVDPITDPRGFIVGRNNDFRPWNYYVVVSTNALSSNPLFVSATANPPADPIHRGPCGDPISGRCGTMYDFLDAVVAPSGEAWAAAVDTCTRKDGARGIDCVKRTKATADGETGSDSAVGVAVRQIGGPRLR